MNAQKDKLLKILAGVYDPEIPVISVLDLGIVRSVEEKKDHIKIDITPTYSGCPAMDVIPQMIEEAFHKEGYTNVVVNNLISPPWTTDWITEAGKQKLKDFGIAPPVEKSTDDSFLTGKDKLVPCPLCGSEDTRLVSRFGSTPCKSAYQCNTCLEPFDYFKCH